MPEPDRETYEAAERLVREAAARAEQAARTTTDGIPAGGWSSGQAPAATTFPDLTALLAVIGAMRGTIPPELARRLADALRELLIAIRAVLDYAIERLESSPPRAREVEDIPIR